MPKFYVAEHLFDLLASIAGAMSVDTGEDAAVFQRILVVLGAKVTESEG